MEYEKLPKVLIDEGKEESKQNKDERVKFVVDDREVVSDGKRIGMKVSRTYLKSPSH